VKVVTFNEVAGYQSGFCRPAEHLQYLQGESWSIDGEKQIAVAG
jgi:hypothetical protein